MKIHFDKNPFSLYFYYYLYCLAFLSVSRFALFLWAFDKINISSAWSSILIQGIGVDIATLCFLLCVPMVYTASTTKHMLLGDFVIKLWLTSIAIFIVFMELATPSFIQEHSIRPNQLFLQYLTYPKEVFGSLIKSRLPELINSTVLTIVAGYVTWKWLTRKLPESKTISNKSRPVAILGVLLFVSLGVSSNLCIKPLEYPAMCFSENSLVNSLTLNSAYSVISSARKVNLRKPQNEQNKSAIKNASVEDSNRSKERRH